VFIYLCHFFWLFFFFSFLSFRFLVLFFVSVCLFEFFGGRFIWFFFSLLSCPEMRYSVVIHKLHNVHVKSYQCTCSSLYFCDSDFKGKIET
jgi:hypothetical protein